MPMQTHIVVKPNIAASTIRRIADDDLMSVSGVNLLNGHQAAHALRPVLLAMLGPRRVAGYVHHRTVVSEVAR